jgi:hypothetical protein
MFAIAISGSIACAADDPPYAVLVAKYAPQVIHPASEPNLPTNVDWLLARTTLSVNDAGCRPAQVNAGPATIENLRNATYTSPCDGHIIMASGTRSKSKARTFLLADVSDADKRGSLNTTEWTTYYHAYKNKFGGWSVQYWFCYSFNTGQTVLVQVGYHGGDWEMFQIDFDSSNNPLSVAMTGHTSIDSAPWTSVHLTGGTHPVVYAESGGHEMHLTSSDGGPQIVHPTWPGSVVFWPGVYPSPPGPLIDLGARLHPLVGFLNYSGLWGSLGVIFSSSGYWGPAFNETGLGADGFLTAWCFNIADPASAESGKRECYPDDILP